MSKVVLKGNFITLNTYLGKEERSKISILGSHSKKLEKQEQIQPKVSKRKEGIKITVKISTNQYTCSDRKTTEKKKADFL